MINFLAKVLFVIFAPNKQQIHMNYKKQIDYNSTENQHIKGLLVQREVYYCQSMVVSEMLQNDLIDWGDISNYYTYRAQLSTGEWEGTEEEKSELIEELEQKAEELEEEKSELIEEIEEQITALEDDIRELESCDWQPQEIYEWWLVSDWLANRLEEMGHPILREMGCTWWGRCCTGQAIRLDYSISKIAEDMEILKGQKYSWENHK